MDLDGMAADYLKRTNRKVPFATEWNYDKEEKRSESSDYHPPSRPEYRLPDGLAVDLRSSIEDIEEKMNEIKIERESIQKEMKCLEKPHQNHLLNQATNTLSAHD
jgi:hypothetical protein